VRRCRRAGGEASGRSIASARTIRRLGDAERAGIHRVVADRGNGEPKGRARDYQYRVSDAEDWRVETHEVASPRVVANSVREHLETTTTVDKDDRVEIGEHAGRDIHFRPRGAHGRTVLVVGRKHVFFVQVIRKDPLGADAHRFIDSFRLTEKPVDREAELEALGGKTLQRDAGTPDAGGWVTARSASGKFSLQLPAKFLEIGVKNAIFVMKADAGRVQFVATCVVASFPDPKAKMGEFEAKFLAEQGPPTRRTDKMLRGAPAVELVYPTTLLFATARPDMLCTLSVESRSKAVTVPIDQARRMFDSLTLH
jgi:hypothetical protein